MSVQTVIPAKAGISIRPTYSGILLETPAFAGVTEA